MTHLGQPENPTQIYEWDGSKKIPIPTPGGGGGGEQDVQNFDVGVCTTQDEFWAGAPDGTGAATALAVLTSAEVNPVNVLAAYVTALPGGAGGITLAIYDVDGNRVCSTAKFEVADGLVIGPNVIPLAIGAGAALAAGSLYYFYCAANHAGIRLAGRTPLSPVSTPFPIYFDFNNPYAFDAEGAPASIPVNGAPQSFNRVAWIAGGA